MKIGSILASLIALAFVGLYLYGVMPASSERLQEIIAISENSPAAKTLVAEFLSTAPVPKNWELANLERDIDAIKVQEISSKIAGQPNLKMAPIKKASSSDISLAEVGIILLGGFSIYAALLVVFRRSKEGDR